MAVLGVISWTWPSKVLFTPLTNALTCCIFPHIPHVFCAYRACSLSTSPLVCLPITCWKTGSACDAETCNAMDPCWRKTRAWMRDSRVMGPTKGPQSKASNVEISGQLGVRHNPGHTTCHNRAFRKIRVSGSKYSPSSPAQLNLSRCDGGGPVLGWINAHETR
jgi:hypothetical protein